MNLSKPQMMAFGAFGLAVIVAIAKMTLGTTDIVIILIGTFIVAILTLKTTWKVIYKSIQVSGVVTSEVGHGVGNVGDKTIDWSRNKHAKVSGINGDDEPSAPIVRKKSSRVPTWGQLGHKREDTGTVPLDSLMQPSS